MINLSLEICLAVKALQPSWIVHPRLVSNLNIYMLIGKQLSQIVKTIHSANKNLLGSLKKKIPRVQHKQEVHWWPSWILLRVKVLFKIRGFNLGPSSKIN